MCRECRRSGKGVSHGSQYAYRKGCRCGACREGQRLRMRAYNEQVRQRDGVSYATQLRRKARGADPLAESLCSACNLPMKLSRGGSYRPLHRECRDSVPGWFRRGEPGPAQRRALARIEKAARGTSGGKRVWTSGKCPWCGNEFTSAGAKFCSRGCRLDARRKVGPSQKFRISPVDRMAIYERDGWVCQLCDHSVDKELKVPHIWAATLDHVIPQSAMLVPDHSPSNLRLAHLWCNSARGNGTNMSEDVFRLRITEMRLAA